MKIAPFALLLAIALSCAADSPCRTDRGDFREGDPCVSTGDCCYDLEKWKSDPTSVLTCSRYDRTCRPGKDLPLGESCESAVQCASRNCDANFHYCTTACDGAACNSETACTKDAWGIGGWLCRPTCQTDDDCKTFGSMGANGGKSGMPIPCTTKKTLGGQTVRVCSL